MDERLKYYEREWRKAIDRAEEAERLLDKASHERDEAERQVKVLESAIEQVKEQRQELIDALKKTAADRERSEEHLKRLQELRELVKSPQFWLDEVAAPFAHEIEMFDLVPQVARSSDRGDPSDMALEAAELLAQLAEKFDLEKASYVRRLLLAQWVYLRWLELIDDTAVETRDSSVR